MDKDQIIVDLQQRLDTSSEKLKEAIMVIKEIMQPIKDFKDSTGGYIKLNSAYLLGKQFLATFEVEKNCENCGNKHCAYIELGHRVPCYNGNWQPKVVDSSDTPSSSRNTNKGDK